MATQGADAASRGERTQRKDRNNSRGGPNASNKARGRGRHHNRGGHDPGRGSQSKPNPKRLSHHLSWALRHAAPELGLTMAPDGYVPVQEILTSSHPKFRGVTLEAIQHVVTTNDKQRFALAERPATAYGASEGTVLCIRANQGHSISTVDPDLLLTRLTSEEVLALPMIVHGTYADPFEKHIRSEGLKVMNRTHVHCASGLVGDVVSGMRKNCQIYVYLHARRCVEADIAFYQSANGVILTAGEGDAGTVPPKYFSHVTGVDGNVILDQR